MPDQLAASLLNPPRLLLAVEIDLDQGIEIMAEKRVIVIPTKLLRGRLGYLEEILA